MPVTLTQALEKVGMENVTLQNLKSSLTHVKMRKAGTEVSFITGKITTDFAVSDRDNITGLVVWVPTDKFTAALKDLEARENEAKAYTQAAELRTTQTPEPEGQKFRIGARVKIADDLGPTMSHFPSGCMATVRYTYAHAYSSSHPNDLKSYCLNLDGCQGDHSWYYEHQLTEVPEDAKEN